MAVRDVAHDVAAGIDDIVEGVSRAKLTDSVGDVILRGAHGDPVRAVAVLHYVVVLVVDDDGGVASGIGAGGESRA